MLSRVKDFLGIEGVQLALALTEPIDARAGRLVGAITFTSLRDQTVERVEVELRERYSRGRGDDVLIDEFVLGRLASACELRVAAGESVTLPFELRFAARPSRIEERLGGRRLLRPVVALAKRVAKAESRYRLWALADVRGVALRPETSLPVGL